MWGSARIRAKRHQDEEVEIGQDRHGWLRLCDLSMFRRGRGGEGAQPLCAIRCLPGHPVGHAHRISVEVGKGIGERGHEFGTVTGRQRRVGWFDAVLVRQTCAISGVTGIALTKIDVLDGLDEVKICTGYRLRNNVYDYFPSHAADQAAVEPIYESMEGWHESTAGARSYADLPANAVKYIQRVQELIETPVALVSTSPERDDTILMRDPFMD